MKTMPTCFYLQNDRTTLVLVPARMFVSSIPLIMMGRRQASTFFNGLSWHVNPKASAQTCRITNKSRAEDIKQKRYVHQLQGRPLARRLVARCVFDLILLFSVMMIFYTIYW